MMKRHQKSTLKAARVPNAFCTLALAMFAAFSAPAMAITAPGLAPVPATLEQTQSTVSTQTDNDPKAVAERDLRSRAMKEAANSYGARSGLLRGNYENQTTLEKLVGTYDAAFNFTPLMLVDTQPVEKGGDGRPRQIRPPVIVESRSAFNQLDPRMIRERDAVYKIESNVQFVPAPPNWRTYLFRSIGETVAALPHFSLMPRTAEEKARWDGWVSEGWKAGHSQSKAILESDLNRLIRDFDGMVLYHELVQQQVLSLPFVAARNDGVTGDDNNLNVNDVTLRITVIPAFQRKSANWVTVVTDPNPKAVPRVTFVRPTTDAVTLTNKRNEEKAVARVEQPPQAFAPVAPAPMVKPLIIAQPLTVDQSASDARAARMARAEVDARASMAILSSPAVSKKASSDLRKQRK